MDGERGLISLLKKQNLLTQLKINEKQIKDEIDNLELKNSLLSESLDLDYVEILIREKFVYTKKVKRFTC